MNNVPRLLALFAVCCVCLASENEANAQRGGRRVPHYSRTATVSPYVNLFQSRNGGVNNYLTEVRPRLQFQRQLNNLQSNRGTRGVNQGNLINQQTTILQETIEQTLQMSLRQGRRSQPAMAGRFMNTGNFFPTRGTSVR